MGIEFRDHQFTGRMHLPIPSIAVQDETHHQATLDAAGTRCRIFSVLGCVAGERNGRLLNGPPFLGVREQHTTQRTRLDSPAT